jgi:hypothetical protein
LAGGQVGWLAGWLVGWLAGKDDWFRLTFYIILLLRLNAGGYVARQTHFEKHVIF